jgi:hypothetical protein
MDIGRLAVASLPERRREGLWRKHRRAPGAAFVPHSGCGVITMTARSTAAALAEPPGGSSPGDSRAYVFFPADLAAACNNDLPAAFTGEDVQRHAEVRNNTGPSNP